MSRRPDVISLFGEVEVIVAKQMMAEGRGVGLLAPTVSHNETSMASPCEWSS